MRIKKIRGHKRIWNAIEKWRTANLNLDLETLKTQERQYVKIWLDPFSGFSLLNSQFPEPKGETRKKIIHGLFDIYNHWKEQLDSLNEPYYLKIWLFEPQFSKSQVVCAIGSFVNFYNNTFYSPNVTKTINLESIGIPKTKIEGFKWEYKLYEEFVSDKDLGTAEDFENESDFIKSRKWYEAKIKKAHRKITDNETSSKIIEYYAFKLGIVWLAEK
jgi:hypothetical protein